MRKNLYGRNLKGEPKKYNLSTVLKSCSACYPNFKTKTINYWGIISTLFMK